MIEKNELRLQYYIAKLDRKIKEEHQIQKEIQQLELRNKLADMYANDKDGYERALRISGAYIEDTSTSSSTVSIIRHQPFQSRL
jgi:hypothetical protein